LAGEKFSYPFRHLKNKTREQGENLRLKLQTKEIALMAIYAALYAVLVNAIPGLSFGPLNLRVADAMLGAVPLLGIAGVIGHTLGVFIGNLPSPLGVIDLLNTIPSFAMAFVVYYIYKRTKNSYTVIGTSIAYSVVLGVTVGWMLSAPFNIPLPLSILYVFAGNVVITTLVGWPIFKLLKKAGVQSWFETCSTYGANKP
jgi:uncharacterized membrane protein